MIKAISISFFLILVSAATLFSQQSGQLGAFDFLPQSVYANPALRPIGRVNIGIPGLSQIHFDHGNNWFKPGDNLVPDANGKVILNAENILKEIDKSAYTGQNLSIELLHLGFRFGKHYVHARASERVQVGLTIPKDIFYLGVYGNTGLHNFEDNKVNFSGLGIDAIHYREYALGYNYQLNKKWSLGLTAKYLYGMERIETEQSTLTLRTDPVTYNMQTSGSFIVNTSGIYSNSSEGVEDIRSDIKSYLLGLKNTGFGADLGLVYRPIEKLQLEFSAIDIGIIKWKTNLASYGTNDASFAYNGIDLTDFIFIEGSEFNDAFQNKLDTLLDNLENTYNFTRTEEKFTTTLNGYFRYAGSYEVLSHEKFTGKAWLSVYHGILDSEAPLTLSIGYNQKLWKVIQADVHFVKRTHFSPSIGAGLSLNAGPFQIYLLAENIGFANYAKITLIDTDNPQDQSSFVYFHNPQDIRLNVGLNLTFGMKKADAPGGQPMKR